jgi:pimeloyl-ACP methyl ester carboxylesterase
MKKFLKIAASVVVLLVLLPTGWFFLTAGSRTALPGPVALASLGTDATVRVIDKPEWLILEPANRTPVAGVVFYQGASTDVRGYAPTLRRIAAAGYRVVMPRMPMNFAIFAQDKALEVEAAFPDIQRWMLIGHSMGGGAGAGFVHDHPDAVAGFVVWDSFPLESTKLTDWGKPVWHVHRATPDGKPPASFEKRRALFPADGPWVPLPGGIHMNFGDFVGGAYKEDWAATMPQAEQHDRVVQATLEGLQAMGGAG